MYKGKAVLSFFVLTTIFVSQFYFSRVKNRELRDFNVLNSNLTESKDIREKSGLKETKVYNSISNLQDSDLKTVILPGSAK